MLKAPRTSKTGMWTGLSGCASCILNLSFSRSPFIKVTQVMKLHLAPSPVMEVAITDP